MSKRSEVLQVDREWIERLCVPFNERSDLVLRLIKCSHKCPCAAFVLILVVCCRLRILFAYVQLNHLVEGRAEVQVLIFVPLSGMLKLQSLNYISCLVDLDDFVSSLAH